MDTKKTRPKNQLSLAIGENIKRFRLKAGMTQAQLAAAIGYKETKGSAGASISRAEAGTQQPRIETLTAIAKALGVEVCELLQTGPGH